MRGRRRVRSSNKQAGWSEGAREPNEEREGRGEKRRWWRRRDVENRSVEAWTTAIRGGGRNHVTRRLRLPGGLTASGEARPGPWGHARVTRFRTSDIMFGSPMYWLWEIIKAEFRGANLYFVDEDN